MERFSKYWGAAVLLLLFCGVFFLTATADAKRIGNGPYDDNCVLYLRNVKNINLQSGLTSWEAKKSIINEDNPKKGRVAIIEVTKGPFKEYGHVALVVDVDDEGKKKSITLEEANYPSRGYWKRTIKGKNIKDIEKKANIIGYYKP